MCPHSGAPREDSNEYAPISDVCLHIFGIVDSAMESLATSLCMCQILDSDTTYRFSRLSTLSAELHARKLTGFDVCSCSDDLHRRHQHELGHLHKHRYINWHHLPVCRIHMFSRGCEHPTTSRYVVWHIHHPQAAVPLRMLITA